MAGMLPDRARPRSVSSASRRIRCLSSTGFAGLFSSTGPPSRSERTPVEDAYTKARRGASGRKAMRRAASSMPSRKTARAFPPRGAAQWSTASYSRDQTALFAVASRSRMAGSSPRASISAKRSGRVVVPVTRKPRRPRSSPARSPRYPDPMTRARRAAVTPASGKQRGEDRREHDPVERARAPDARESHGLLAEVLQVEEVCADQGAGDARHEGHGRRLVPRQDECRQGRDDRRDEPGEHDADPGHGPGETVADEDGEARGGG